MFRNKIWFKITIIIGIFASIAILFLSVMSWPLVSPVGVYEFTRDDDSAHFYIAILDDGMLYTMRRGGMPEETIFQRHKWIRSSNEKTFVVDGQSTSFRAFQWGLQFNDGEKLEKCRQMSPELEYLLKKLDTKQIFWEKEWEHHVDGGKIQRGSIILDEEQVKQPIYSEKLTLKEALVDKSDKMIFSILTLDALMHSAAMEEFDKTQIQLVPYNLNANETRDLLAVARRLYPQTMFSLLPNFDQYTRIGNQNLRIGEIKDHLQFPAIVLENDFRRDGDCENGGVIYYHEKIRDDANVHLNYRFSRENGIPKIVLTSQRIDGIWTNVND